MSPGFHARSFAPVGGLGGVRALAGLGCGGACACQNQATGSVMDVVKSPLFVLVAGVVLVGGYVLVREALR